MIQVKRQNIETARLFLKPYETNYFQAVFLLIQKNKIRLTLSFPILLKGTETIESTKDFVQQKIGDWNKTNRIVL